MMHLPRYTDVHVVHTSHYTKYLLMYLTITHNAHETFYAYHNFHH